MNFLRFGIIAAAHLVALGIVYFLSSLGSEEGGTSTAGANGLVTWSSQEPNADRSIVDSASGLPFDGRSGDLRGYNLDDKQAPVMVAQNSASSSQRFEPTRPANSGSAQSNSNDDLLLPVNPPRSQSYARSAPATPLPQFIEYTVVSGDSLWGISKRYNVSIPEIEAANPGTRSSPLQVGKQLRIPRNREVPIAASSAPSQSSSPKVQGTSYTVRPGDSLSKIAANQGTTVSALKAANGLRSDIIRVGQDLVVPNAINNQQLASQQWTGRKIVIKPGDTLGKISALYDADVNEIMRLNKITNARLIRIGQTILIPDSGPVNAAKSSPTLNSNAANQKNQSIAVPAKTVVEKPEPMLPPDPVLDIEEDSGLLIEEDPVDEPLIEIEE